MNTFSHFLKKGTLRDNLLIFLVLMPLAIIIFFYAFTPAGETQDMSFTQKGLWAFEMLVRLLPRLARWEQFRNLLLGTGISFGLIASSLLFALPLSCLIGSWCAEKKGRSWLRISITVTSAIPVFVTMDWVPNHFCWGLFVLIALNFGLAWRVRHFSVTCFSIGVAALFILLAIWQPKFSWGVFFLVLGNLILANLTRHVYVGMLRELRELYVITAQLKGVPAHRHYWRRLVVLLITPIKSQFPYYLSAAVVVEWKLSLYGVGHIAYDAAAKTTPPDLFPIAGVCILTVIIVRILNSFIEWISKRLLPSRDAKLEQAKIESQGHGRNLIDRTRDFTGWLLSLRLPRVFHRRHQVLSPPFSKTVQGRTGHEMGERRLSRFAYRNLISPFSPLLISIRSYLRGSFSRQMVFGLTLCLLLFTAVLFWGATRPLPYRDIDARFTDAQQRREVLSWYIRGRANKSWKVDRWLIWRNSHEQVESLSPDRGWLFGPNFEGNPVLSDLLKGTKPYLLPALKALTLSVLLGVLLAAIAGYRQHGVIHYFIQNFVDFLDALPKLVVLLALYAQVNLENYYNNMMPFIGILFIPDIYHSVKEQVIHLRQSVFVEAERALGAGVFRILLRHILWKNSMATVLIGSAYVMGSLILIDTMLAYLRVNPSNIPTWGSLIVTNYDYLKKMEGANVWGYIVPSAAIVLSITAFNLLGDGVRVLFAGKSTEAR